jgi:lysozyme
MLKFGKFFSIGPIVISLWACSAADPISRPETQNDVARQENSLSYPAFADIDAHEGVGSTPKRYPVHGIDVSRWQGDIDWQSARAAGIAFAYLKATEGGDILDPMFRNHWDGAKNAGVRHGAYHYFYFCRPAEEQARWFIRHVPRDPTALPPVLDMEWNHQSPTCQLRPNGAKVRAEAKRFLDILERHYGRRPVVYTTVDFFQDTQISQLKNTRFWVRSVAGHPSEIYPGHDWTFWQYTGTGVVPGVQTPVDINVFAGTQDQWSKWSN